MNFENVSNKEIFTLISKRITQMHKNIGGDFYPDLINDIQFKKCPNAEKHLKIKHYQAIDRIKFYIADRLLNKTHFSLDFDNLVKNKERKALKAIAIGLHDIEYSEIREIWHNEMKDKFYVQREQIKVQEKLSKSAIVFRHENEQDRSKSGFVSINAQGTVDIVVKISNATEFPVLGFEEHHLKTAEKRLLNKYLVGSRAIMTTKMKGRKTFFL